MCAARRPHKTPSGETRLGHSRVWGGVLPVVILVVAVGLPRLFELDRFITIDEPIWVRRSASFYSDLVQGDFANTFKKEHPGVTVMWAGSAGILSLHFFAPDAEQSGLSPGGHTITVQNQLYRLLDVLAAARFFMVLANTLAIVLAFIYARHLLGPLAAFVGFLLIAFDPFHVAHSRLLHLDALTSSLLLLAFLAFLSYLHRRRVSALLVSGVAVGLAGLTRATAVFIVPAILSVVVLDAWTRRSGSSRTGLLTVVWQSVWPLLLQGIVAVAVIVALWPAMWVDPIGTVAKVLEPALSQAVGGHENPVFFNGQLYPDGQIDLLSFYPITYLWRSTPVVLAGLLAAGAGFVLKRGPLRRSRVRRTVVGLMLFVVVFALFQSLGSKKFDRYLLPIYAALDLIAGTGYVVIARGLESGRFRLLRRYAAPLLLATVLVLQAAGTVRTFPYYLSYYNPLMGGSSKAPETMLVGWGEGLDQAAEYLTELSRRRALVPASWYFDVFAHFYPGPALPVPLRLGDAELQNLLSADYAVIYIHQWSRQMPRQLLDVLAQRDPVHSIWIDGLEYVRIYNLQAPPSPPEPSQMVQEGNLGGAARLVGYDPSLPVQVEDGVTLPLTLTWESIGPFDADYTVFIHLTDADGRPVAQADSQPLGGAYATTRWHVGERLADPYELSIPPDLLPGEYELLVGMYLLSTGERLPLLSSDGQIVGDSVSLGRVEIAEP
jgi:hypothetical protein